MARTKDNKHYDMLDSEFRDWELSELRERENSEH